MPDGLVSYKIYMDNFPSSLQSQKQSLYLFLFFPIVTEIVRAETVCTKNEEKRKKKDNQMTRVLPVNPSGEEALRFACMPPQKRAFDYIWRLLWTVSDQKINHSSDYLSKGVCRNGISHLGWLKKDKARDEIILLWIVYCSSALKVIQSGNTFFSRKPPRLRYLFYPNSVSWGRDSLSQSFIYVWVVKSW